MGRASLLDQRGQRVDLVMQVAPLRVHLFDEPYLPRPLPGLDLLLAADGGLHRLPVFVPDQRLHTVAGGEAGRGLVLVVTHPRPQRTCDPDIDRAAIAVRHDVDGGVFLDGHCNRLTPRAPPGKAGPRPSPG